MRNLPIPARTQISRVPQTCKAIYLTWLYANLGRQCERLERKMSAAGKAAHRLAARNLRSRKLEARRQRLRAEHRITAQRWLTVRKELDALSQGLPSARGLVLAALAALLTACGGGGCHDDCDQQLQQQDVPTPHVQCGANREQCK